MLNAKMPMLAGQWVRGQTGVFAMRFSGLASIFVLAWLALFGSLLRTEGAGPNVLFFYSDDQRADTVAALGNSQIYTPNLDRLARAGVSFTGCHVMGGLQGAVYVPSRAMLMTSRGLFRVKEDMAGQRTWPEQFAELGYRTFITGKWHNGEASLTRAFQEGETIFLGGMSEAVNMPVRGLAGGKLGEERKSGVHHTELFAGSAMRFLERQTDARPFFCYVAFKVPHDPRTATPAWHARYDQQQPPVPPNFLPLHPFNNGEMTVRDEQLLPWPRTEAAVRQAWADYYACISHMDQQIGLILDQLQTKGLATNTLIVFAGDNGLALGSHGLLGKQSLYEHSTGVPLIIAGPGVPENQRTSALCYLLDVMPTVAELANVPALAGSEGVSLVPVMRARSGGRDQLFTAYRDLQRAVRDSQWKLIRYPKIDKTQLFDLRRDPFEITDVSGVPENRPVLESLLEALQRQQKNWGDTLALSVDHPQSPNWTPPSK